MKHLEGNTIDTMLTKESPKTLKEYVLVQSFREESFKRFCEDVESVLETRQDILPIVIDSYGGQVYTLLAMIDYLSTIEIPIVTLVAGKAMSCGADLFAVGDTRYVGQHASIMVHDVSDGFWGQNNEIQTEAKETQRISNLLFALLDKNTRQRKGYWKKQLAKNKHTNLYLTPKQAVRHKLATDIGTPRFDCEIVIQGRTE